MYQNRKGNKPFSPCKPRKVLNKSLVGRSPRKCPSASVNKAAPRGASCGVNSTNMRVLVRVRPMNVKEVKASSRTILKVVDDKMLIFDPPQERGDFFFKGSKQSGRDMLQKQHKNSNFLFDKVFGMEATNEQVFKESTMSIVSSIFDGFNCSVFAYGATGAGKTYTMLGSEENPGIVYRTMVELYRQVEEQRNEKEFDIRISYLEVYNETVNDLLNPGNPLHLREDGNGVEISGLKMERIFNPDRMFELLKQGNTKRSQHPTDANAESSRSHAVFQVFIKMSTKTSGQTKFVKLSLIDLAGSERGVATGCSGARFKEGSNINKSLLALGNCINALADGLRHIPYRDSKLTRILKDSLGGNCRTVMIANVSPAHFTAEDTHNTLKYAQRAKAIKVKISKNIFSVPMHVSNYIKINEELQKKVQRLEQENHTLREELLAKREETIKSECPQEPNSNFHPQVASETIMAKSDVPNDAVEREESHHDILLEAEKLFHEKALLQKRYLNLDSSEKVCHIQMHLKEKAFDRVSALSSTPCRKDATKAKVERSLEQFNGRLISANECQQRIALQKSQIDKSLQNLEELAKRANIYNEFRSRLETLQLQLSNQELLAQSEHVGKLLSIYINVIENQDQLIYEISEAFRHYYNLLRGHGHVTEQMLSKHNTLMHHLENIKSINWISDNTSNKNSMNHLSTIEAITKSSAKLSLETPLSETALELEFLKNPSATSNLESNKFVADISDLPGAGLSDVANENVLKQLPLTQNYPHKGISSVEQVHLHSIQPTDQEPESVDTAIMLDTLGQLDSKVETLLNASILGKESDEEKLVNLPQNHEFTLPSLNSTFDASDKFSSTLNKDCGSTESTEKCENLNVTFEKPSKSSLEIEDALNSTFSISSSLKRIETVLSPAVATQQSSGVSTSKSALPKTPQAVASSYSLQSHPQVRKTKSSLEYSVPSAGPGKYCAANRYQEDSIRTLKKGSTPLERSVPSKLLSIGEKTTKTAPFSSTTKFTCNKENKFTVPSVRKVGTSLKFGVVKGVSKNEAVTKILNGTFTKDCPK